MAARNKTIKDAQQELAEYCGYKNEIIWDLITSEDRQKLVEKIKQLIPDQEKGQDRIQELRSTIFKSVWNQGKYTNGNSFSYIFYVMVTNDENFNTAPNSTKYSMHPIFRCKKCDDDSNTRNCCMIYIDETGRVYQNWKSFINENVLPAGTMITPRRGIYNFNNDKVILDVYCTPNGTPEAKAMNVLQTTSAVAGIGSSLALIALPAVAPAAVIVGLGVGIFTALTSISNLKDRKKHEESISVTNRQARADYLGVVGGAIGVVGAGATRVMTSMAAVGKATKGIEILVNGINITSIVLSGSGVANGALDLIFKYVDDQKISKLDVLQLSASLFLFTHSVRNFQLASQLANDVRAGSIQSYRETLSNRQRRMFDKLSKETLRIRGNTNGKMDIIRGINEIPNRQYLNDLFKINKQLNKRNVRPAFDKSGKNIVLNNELPIDTTALRQNLQYNQGSNLLDQVTKPIPSTLNSGQSSNMVYSGITSINFNVLEEIRAKISVVEILQGGCKLLFQQYGKKFENNVADENKLFEVFSKMADHLEELVVKFLLEQTNDFINCYKDIVEKILQAFISTETILYRILKFVLDKYSDLSYKYISRKGKEIIAGVKTYFLSLNSRGVNRKQLCPDCNGFTYMCTV